MSELTDQQRGALAKLRRNRDFRGPTAENRKDSTMSTPTVEDQLAVLGIIRGFVNMDGPGISALFPDASDAPGGLKDCAIGLAATAAHLVDALASARGITPKQVMDELVQRTVNEWS